MSIFVGNLSYEITEADIHDVFSEYGSVKRVLLPVDRETGRMRGFGLVEMSSDAEEEAAIDALNGAEWMGRDLRVTKAKPREEKANSIWRSDSGTAIAIGESSNAKDRHDSQKSSSASEHPSRNSGHQRELNTFLKTELSPQKSSANKEITLVLKGDLSDVSKTDLIILTNHLRKLSCDQSIEIVQVEEGSIILKLSGTDEGFRVIKELWDTGKLTTLIGLAIESVDYEVVLSADYSDNSVPIENIEQVNPSCKNPSEGSVNFIFDRCVVNQNNQTALSRAVITTDIQGEDMSEHYVNNLQGANIANMANTVQDNARLQANQHIHSSEQKKTLAEAASEIQQLLRQLEQSEPKASDARKVTYINDETSPSFKRRVVGALQAGGESAIEEFLDNPYVNIGKAIVKGWMKPE